MRRTFHQSIRLTIHGNYHCLKKENVYRRRIKNMGKHGGINRIKLW